MAESDKRTGLAQRMREWMKGRNRPFSRRMLCEGLAIPEGKPHQRAINAFKDFIARGEITLAVPAQQDKRQIRNFQKFRYNHAYKAGYDAPIGVKILKAMYVHNGNFTCSDIQRLSEAADQSYIQRILTRLARQGYLLKAGEKPCVNSRGAEYVYRVMSREQFKVALL